MQTCPSCKSARLEHSDLEPGLKARLCPHCRGHWIPFADYLPWVEAGAQTADPALLASDETAELFGDLPADRVDPLPTNGGAMTPTSPAPPSTPSATRAKVKLCPECGRFLRRYHLGMGIDLEVDRCGGCAGMWCDRGKWSRLRTAGAHGRLHLLCSDSWQ